MKPIAPKLQRHPDSEIIPAAIGIVTMPPKLLPDVTMPIIRPRVVGNHRPTRRPTGIIVVPGTPTTMSVVNR